MANSYKPAFVVELCGTCCNSSSHVGCGCDDHLQAPGPNWLASHIAVLAISVELLLLCEQDVQSGYDDLWLVLLPLDRLLTKLGELAGQLLISCWA